MNEKNPNCPNCGETLKIFKEYQYGLPTADGYECPSCGKYYEFGEV